jgi:AGCS family alanine or glycine:cation symporter
MIFDAIHEFIQWFISWPLIIYVSIIGVIYTIAFKGIQFRRFFYSWRITLFPPKALTSTPGQKGDTSPLQAFINTLSTGVGNGSIAGMGIAIFAGGPGATLWALVFGVLLMAVRLAEVYLSVLYGSRQKSSSVLGGPMLYLKAAPFGTILAYTYAIACLFLGLSLGSSMQANSIAVILDATWAIKPIITAIPLTLFILYVLLGGAKRVGQVTSKLVPLNLAVFFLSTISLLIFHYASLYDALALIWHSAFHPTAAIGGVLGFSVQQAIRLGMLRSIMATESGLGTAAILFGFTGGTSPLKDALMSMIGTFISAVVCSLVGLCIVVSGVWSSGLNSTALTGAAFSTVFCKAGGAIVSFLSLSFGISVMVGFVYITRAVWLFLTNGRYPSVFVLLYAGSVALGAVAKIMLIWNIADIVTAVMLVVNLFGLLCLMPEAVRIVSREENQLS